PGPDAHGPHVRQGARRAAEQFPRLRLVQRRGALGQCRRQGRAGARRRQPAVGGNPAGGEARRSRGAAAQGMRRALCLGAAALLVGCATDEQKRNAINEVNAEFRSEYERILAERGTRLYRVRFDEAYSALRIALARVGMRVGDQSPSIGYLHVFGSAPAPLTKDEWDRA